MAGSVRHAVLTVFSLLQTGTFGFCDEPEGKQRCDPKLLQMATGRFPYRSLGDRCEGQYGVKLSGAPPFELASVWRLFCGGVRDYSSMVLGRQGSSGRVRIQGPQTIATRRPAKPDR